MAVMGILAQTLLVLGHAAPPSKRYNRSRVGSRGDIMVALLPAIITLLAVVMTVAFGIRVSVLRGKYKIDPPATTGNPAFERAYRIHANTIEAMVVFLPMLWLGAMLYSETIAFWLGIGWLVGRVGYMVGFTMDPKKRVPGFAISALCVLGLMIITIMGLVM
jgi:glutathione S-transferase